MSIVLSLEMSILINDILEKNFSISKKSMHDSKYCEFTKEELELIDNLEIVNFSSLQDLIHFPNLRSLSLRGASYNNISPEIDYDESSVINHITDFSPLFALSSLEELIIENDLYLQTLDLRYLKRLKRLIIINNPLLREIKGLDELEFLENVIMYGNSITTAIDMHKYVSNTRLTTTNILDIGMYLPMIGGNKEGAKELKDLEISSMSTVQFAEKSGFLSFTKVSPQNLYDMFVKLDTMFRRNHVYELSDVDKVNYVFNYILKNITFSKQAIVKRDHAYNEALEKYMELPEQLKPSLASIHSGYRTYYFKSGNCEGRVNLMVFMLKMLGIEAYDVHCRDRRGQNLFGPNHAIVRVHLDGEALYCEPTVDPKFAFNYLLVDYEAISKLHELDSFEKHLSESMKKKK